MLAAESSGWNTGGCQLTSARYLRLPHVNDSGTWGNSMWPTSEKPRRQRAPIDRTESR